jgi:hypothetical protein
VLNFGVYYHCALMDSFLSTVGDTDRPDTKPRRISYDQAGQRFREVGVSDRGGDPESWPQRQEAPGAPSPISSARGPPQGDFILDQTPAFDPTEAEPPPDFVFDQSLPDEFDD